MKLFFVESRRFSETVALHNADRALNRLQLRLELDPLLGDVIEGCGSLRKILLEDMQRGLGKRSGLRLIYLYVPEVSCIYFVLAYGKNVQADLDHSRKREMKQYAEAIKEQLIRRIRKSGRK